MHALLCLTIAALYTVYSYSLQYILSRVVFDKMKTPALVLVVTLFLICGQSQPANTKSDAHPVAIQAVQYIKLLHTRITRQTDEELSFGSCSVSDLQEFGRNYPLDCSQTFASVGFSGLSTGDSSGFGVFSSILCNARCGQPIVDIFANCGFEEIAEIIAYSCNTNANGIACGRLLNSSIFAVSAAEQACSSFTTVCPTDCQNGLRNIQNAVGCCGNFTRLRLPQFPAGFDFSVANSTLWDLCDITTPDPCTPGPLRASDRALTGAMAVVTGLSLLTITLLVF